MTPGNIINSSHNFNGKFDTTIAFIGQHNFFLINGNFNGKYNIACISFDRGLAMCSSIIRFWPYEHKAIEQTTASKHLHPQIMLEFCHCVPHKPPFLILYSICRFLAQKLPLYLQQTEITILLFLDKWLKWD